MDQFFGPAGDEAPSRPSNRSPEKLNESGCGSVASMPERTLRTVGNPPSHDFTSAYLSMMSL